jgi:hypothetical protein
LQFYLFFEFGHSTGSGIPNKFFVDGCIILVAKKNISDVDGGYCSWLDVMVSNPKRIKNGFTFNNNLRYINFHIFLILLGLDSFVRELSP